MNAMSHGGIQSMEFSRMYSYLLYYIDILQGFF